MNNKKQNSFKMLFTKDDFQMTLGALSAIIQTMASDSIYKTFFNSKTIDGKIYHNVLKNILEEMKNKLPEEEQQPISSIVMEITPSKAEVLYLVYKMMRESMTNVPDNILTEISKSREEIQTDNEKFKILIDRIAKGAKKMAEMDITNYSEVVV